MEEGIGEPLIEAFEELPLLSCSFVLLIFNLTYYLDYFEIYILNCNIYIMLE